MAGTSVERRSIWASTSGMEVSIGEGFSEVVLSVLESVTDKLDEVVITEEEVSYMLSKVESIVGSTKS